MSADAQWPRASAWLAGEERASSRGATLAVIGVPARRGSITPGRCDLAPQALRAALARYSTWDFDAACDVRAVRVTDAGDLAIADKSPAEMFEPASNAIRDALRANTAAVVLGGDNSITRPGVHALGVPLERCALLTIDAHLDLRDLDAGLSNGNPVRALLADGLLGRSIAQIGIQSFANSPQYAAFAREAGIHVVTAGAVHRYGIDAVITEALDRLAARAGAIYVDLDLDVMDRICAPGTPGSRPGGLTPADVRRAAHLCGRRAEVRAMDLVELDPEKDIADTTALAGAACLLSFASGLLCRAGTP